MRLSSTVENFRSISVINLGKVFITQKQFKYYCPKKCSSGYFVAWQILTTCTYLNDKLNS